ncbi:CHAP domain-containing protein [Mycobacterium aquaticum]|uniref:CHAP domain-containing protein n=1 Tax=Mycobacterium aquaticum TaxID=1927124 RepID=A0A1X0B7T6_9MYCO|nr:CHAP domain-containing protein [Mycobacterium aquaticum]ORA38269.1 CHAP domain-containing protein [Mycobacterium aquaticum]
MHRRAWRILLVMAALVMLAVAALAGYRGYREHVAQPDFPDVDTSQLSPGRAAVVRVLAQEYAAQSGMSKYSEGNDEPWCADFTSWVMRESGKPFANPNSGHWRIPGVMTLTDYLQAEGRWEPPEYSPQPGDMVLYDAPSPKGQHVNIVLINNNGTLTTVGGNEGRNVALSTYKIADDPGIRGFGRYE